MYSFEGDFRTRPVQSLRGSSKQEQRISLIQRNKEERRKREEQRQRVASSIVIQSFYRGCKVREQKRNEERQIYDACVQNLQRQQQKVDSPARLTCLVRQLLFFYNNNQDAQRLTSLCQVILKERDAFLSSIGSEKDNRLYQISNLLLLCCRYLDSTGKRNNPIAVPMRILEVFTTPDSYKHIVDDPSIVVQAIFLFLVNKGYFRYMNVLINERIPSSLERTTHPPTPVAASIYDLVMKPVQLVSSSANSNYRDAVLQSFSQELLCPAFSEQVRNFLLPSMVSSKQHFPFVELLQALLPVDAKNGLDIRQAATTQQLSVQGSPWLLLALLAFSDTYLEKLSPKETLHYIQLLQELVPLLPPAPTPRFSVGAESDSDDDERMDTSENESDLAELREECLRQLNTLHHVRCIVSSVARNPNAETLIALCRICHSLVAQHRMTVHKTRLLYSIAFNPSLVRHLWYACLSVSAVTVTGAQSALLPMLSRGLEMAPQDVNRIVPLVSVFASVFSHSLLSLHDTEFYGEDTVKGSSGMPFTLSELIPMTVYLRDACLGIIELVHPDSKPILAFKGDSSARNILGEKRQYVMTHEEFQKQRKMWIYLFKVLAHLVKQLYARDSRRMFCPEGHWLARQVNKQGDKPSQIYRSDVFARSPFEEPGSQIDDDGPPLSTSELRYLTILTELPFVVSFQERVKIFQKLVQKDKEDHQGSMTHFLSGPHINVLIRRNYIYEDAFDKLSPENEPNLRLKMQIQLVNAAGMDEAGIDGGGIFREFLNQLLKSSFDPNRGFFKMTTDQLIFPNPQAQLFVDHFTNHYFFIGRMLGKAIYENMLTELPFASFFLSKILSRHSGDVDINHLASLDPEMYKNLLFLKAYEGDVSDLGLDFTVVNNELGEAQVVELKPGGRDIPVDASNRIEYIHLMADYRLNKQMRSHCYAFRQGLADVIHLEWLRMFDQHELQVLISGAHVPVDLEDLKQNTNYSGGYTADHPVIHNFWKVVDGFTDNQKRQLLKFVTSCSRPPLLGFKELYPAFCIHHAGDELDRLPTASTCMNLLKLPEFKDEDSLRQKLVYAVESEAGFELS